MKNNPVLIQNEKDYLILKQTKEANNSTLLRLKQCGATRN